MRKILLFVFLLPAFQLAAQLQESSYPYKAYFDEAYQLYPDVPRGLLEAVSYTNTHIRHINPLAEETSCAGLPGFYGVMGLVLDGKGYFRENLKTVANLSGESVNDIITSSRTNILAYAAACHNLLTLQKNKKDLALSISKVLISLSELNISNNSAVNDYTMNLYLYGIFYFLNDKANQEKYGFPDYSIDMAGFFGEANIKVFTAKQINISGVEVSNNDGQIYAPVYLSGPCPDYVQPNCTWVESPNHYTGWNGHTISAIAIHTVQGSYTSCINWFQNTEANAATHYVVASNSAYAGQVTQMVNEDNAGWHVTTENWYAIGYEHEGWVDDSTWYTPTMYQTSAALTRDICTRQNINPLRTFFREVLDDGTVLDDGLHSLGGETACVKIKGHQHFYGQTHTDPGPNWKWDYYYKLINNTTPVTTYTAASGTFYDTGGASASYGNDERQFWLIQPENAQTVTLTFSQFAVEANYDFLYIYDGDDEFAPLIGRYNTISPTTVTSTGGSLFIEFRSDCATVGTGWAATWTSVLLDLVAPTTVTSVAGSWQTQNFNATFTDTDNAGGSGIEKSFYQVLDYDGTEWHANAQNGFFADNFDSYNASVWNVPAGSGTWNVTAGNLIQSDTTVSNTNIYASLNQNLSNRYIYQFYVKLDDASSGTNQHRFGFHFFSDNGSLSNRGNSYFIFLRQESSKLEFYKVVNDVFTQTKVVDGVITAFDQWYDLKVIFDRITGKIDVYRDNVLLGTWTDPSPLTTTGNYISLRTGNCKAYISELKVYRSRYPSVTVSVGSAATNDIRYQNPDPATYAAKIKSIVNDAAGNLSTIDYYNLNIDWTIPVCNTVNDGTGADISTTTSSTTLSANWAASSDPNSGIAKYWYAIGTTPGGTDVVGWTDNALNTSVTKSGLSLTDGQMYYFSIKTENGAGLINICNSNGVQAMGDPGHTISGKTRYAARAYAGNPTPNLPTYNSAIYNIDHVIVTLKNYPAGTVVAKDTSDALGQYQFSNIMNGEYMLSYVKYAADTMQWCNDANAADVSIIMYFIASDTLFDPSRCFSAKYKKAADVDNNGFINAIDVARIKAKIGSPYTISKNFPHGNWDEMSTLVTIAGSDLTMNLETICNGDYNASSTKYRDSLTTWSGAKTLPADIMAASEEYVSITDPAYFEIPLRIDSKMNEFSALGLELSYPEGYELVNAYLPKVTGKNSGVKINPALEEVITDNNDLLVTDEDGVLRIVYATTNHFDVAANDELIVLGFRALNKLPQGAVEFKLSGTGVIANQFGEENPEAHLLMPKLFVSGNLGDAEFDLSGYPNPFSESTSLNFYSSCDQHVTIILTDMLGRKILVADKNFSAGNHDIIINSDELKLSKGVYMLTLCSDQPQRDAVSVRLVRY